MTLSWDVLALCATRGVLLESPKGPVFQDGNFGEWGLPYKTDGVTGMLVVSLRGANLR